MEMRDYHLLMLSVTRLRQNNCLFRCFFGSKIGFTSNDGWLKCGCIIVCNFMIREIDRRTEFLRTKSQLWIQTGIFDLIVAFLIVFELMNVDKASEKNEFLCWVNELCIVRRHTFYSIFLKVFFFTAIDR